MDDDTDEAGNLTIKQTAEPTGLSTHTLRCYNGHAELARHRAQDGLVSASS
jgi:hypothetical protein